MMTTYDDWKTQNPWDDSPQDEPPDDEADPSCEHSQPPCDGCAEADRLRGGTATYCTECSSVVPPGAKHVCDPTEVAERQAAFARLEWDALRSWAYRQGMHVARLRGVPGPVVVNKEDERG